MRRRRQEIEVFSVSALDLFASAMGAFLLIAVILFPFHKNKALKKLEGTHQQLMAAQKQCTATGAALEKVIDTTQKQQNAAEQNLTNCLARESQTYLAIVMRWPSTSHDIDLHVVDPAGREYNFRHNNRTNRDFPGSGAELSADTQRGPGIEIWETAKAQPGAYRIFYTFYSMRGNPAPAPVNGTIYYRNGSKNLPDATLSRAGEKRPIAVIDVAATGEIVVR